MRLVDWESTIQQIVNEFNHEKTEAGKRRLVTQWRVKLEKGPTHLGLHQIDQIMQEVWHRLGDGHPHRHAITGSANFRTDIPASVPEELIQTILNRPNLRIERIVSHGHASPEGFWYDQEQHEFVVLLQGAARLRFEDESVEMKPGSFIDIPAHRRHRVEWTSPEEPTIWLAVHYAQDQR